MTRRAHIRGAPPKRFTPCLLLRPRATVAAREHLQALAVAPDVSTGTRPRALGSPTESAATIPPPVARPEGRAGRCGPCPLRAGATDRRESLSDESDRPLRTVPSTTEASGSRGTPLATSRWTSQRSATAPASPPWRRRSEGRGSLVGGASRSASAAVVLADGACGVRSLRRDLAGPFELVPAEAFRSSVPVVMAPRGLSSSSEPPSPQLSRVQRLFQVASDPEAPKRPRPKPRATSSPRRPQPLSRLPPREVAGEPADESAAGVERALSVGSSSSRKMPAPGGWRLPAVHRRGDVGPRRVSPSLSPKRPRSAAPKSRWARAPSRHRSAVAQRLAPEEATASQESCICPP